MSNKPQVYITGVGISSGTFYNTVDQLEDNWQLFKIAVDKAYRSAGVKPEQINVSEIYNAFAIQEILGIESAGFAPYGEGWKLVADGHTHHDGKFPVNVDGKFLTNIDV